MGVPRTRGMGVSYGFRPGRSAHDALQTVRRTVMAGGVQCVYQADIRGFFDHLDHAWLLRMLEIKVGYPWILRLIRKWLHAGIFDQETVTYPLEGAPPGGPLSPLLANIYLHYVLDLWVDTVVRPQSRRGVRLVRYAGTAPHHVGVVASAVVVPSSVSASRPSVGVSEKLGSPVR